MGRSTIHIVTDCKSPRLRYAAKHLLENIIGCHCVFGESRQEDSAIVLAYTANTSHGAFRIEPCSSVFQAQGITPLPDCQFGEWEGLPTLFHTGKSDLPFDIFAATFFLLSRWEEYATTRRDAHGRFPAAGSIAGLHNFIHRPLIDEWALRFRDLLKQRFPQFEYEQREFRLIPTFDIDYPHKYRNKGILLSLAAIGRDLAKGRFATLKERLRTLLGIIDDPYFSFPYLVETLDKHAVSAKFFLLKGKYGGYDRKTLYPSPRLRHVLRKLSVKHEVGVHPSYAAAYDMRRIIAEKQAVERCCNVKVRSARFHFLKLQLPDSYHNLEKAHLTDDYTLLHADDYGFRAGTSIPFRFYDLVCDAELPITVHPTCVMDVTLKNTLRLDPATAAQIITDLKAKVRQVNGDFIPLFHNSSLGEDIEWRGWRTAFEAIFR